MKASAAAIKPGNTRRTRALVYSCARGIRAVALRTRIVGGTRAQLAVTAALLIASFASQVGVTRRFGLGGLGEFTGVTLVIFLAGVLASNGIPVAASRRIAHALQMEDEAGARHTTSVALGLILITTSAAAALVWVLWPLAAAVLQIPNVLRGSVVALAVIGAGVVALVPVVLQARLRPSAAGLVAISQPLAVVVGLGIDTLRPGIRPAELAVLAFTTSGAMSLVALAFLRSTPSLSMSEARALLAQSAASLPIVYATVLSSWVDRLVLSAILGPAGLGAYQAAYAVFEGALRIPRSLTPFLLTAYARVAATHATQTARVLAVQTRIGTAYGGALAAAIFAGADGLVTTVFGFGSGAIAPPLRVMAIGIVPAIGALAYATAATAQRDASSPAQIARWAVPLEVTLVASLGAAFGAVGAAVAIVGMSFIVIAAFARTLGRDDLAGARTLLRPGSILTLALVTALLAGAMPLPWYVASAIAAGVTLAGSAVLLGGPDERSTLRALARF